MPGASGDDFLERWADSFLGTVGSDEAVLSRWLGVLDLLLVLRKVRVARSIALDGRISLEAKVGLFSETIGQSLAGSLPENLDRLLVPLLEGNLWNDLPELKEKLESGFDARVGRVLVKITSSEGLSPELKGKVLRALEGAINTGGAVGGVAGREVSGNRALTVRPVWDIDPSLLAGLEIRIGSRVWDASLAARLRELGKQLLKTA